MAPLIPLAIALATEFAPGLIASIAGDKAGKVAEKVVGIAREAVAPGTADGDLAAALRTNPEAQLAFVKEANSLEVETLREGTKRIQAVNETMRAEKDGPWWVSGWRPYWGFTSGTAFIIAVVGVLAIMWRAIGERDFETIRAVPEMVTALAFLFSIPGAVLGVTAWHRGMMQRQRGGAR